MPLVKSTLETKIKEALTYGQTADPESNPEDVLNETSKMLADAIDLYIKSAIVSTTVIGTTTVPTPAGPVIVPLVGGSGTGNLS